MEEDDRKYESGRSEEGQSVSVEGEIWKIDNKKLVSWKR
jgi:hypothetical protein